MKTDKRGMLWVDGVGDRRSQAILAQHFSGQTGDGNKTRKRPVAAAERAYNARSGGRLLTTEHP
jgi:hypothetical protein